MIVKMECKILYLHYTHNNTTFTKRTPKIRSKIKYICLKSFENMIDFNYIDSYYRIKMVVNVCNNFHLDKNIQLSI